MSRFLLIGRTGTWKDTQQWRPSRQWRCPGGGRWRAGRRGNTSRGQWLCKHNSVTGGHTHRHTTQHTESHLVCLTCWLLWWERWRWGSFSWGRWAAGWWRPPRWPGWWLKQQKDRGGGGGGSCGRLHFTATCECVWNVLCTDWRPARYLWSAGRWWSPSGSPDPGGSR